MSLIWPSMKTTRGFDGHLALKAPGVPRFRILTQSLLMVILIGLRARPAAAGKLSVPWAFFSEAGGRCNKTLKRKGETRFPPILARAEAGAHNQRV